MLNPFIRTKDGIKYSHEEIDDKNKLDESCKFVKFNYDECGTCIELFIDNINGLSEKEIINKAIKQLVNFDNIQIRDCYK